MQARVLREVIKKNSIFKMSLGKNATYEREALELGALIFQSESRLYDTVVEGDSLAIERAAALVKSKNYPTAGAPEAAWNVWVKSIGTFRGLSAGTIVLHWEADLDHLHWGVVDSEPFKKVRDEKSDFDQPGYVFSRKLIGGWRKTSVNNVQLSNIHPKARNLAINMATINQVQTNPDFFRALLLDESIDDWILKPDWIAEARKHGWHAKPISELKKVARRKIVTPEIEEIADHFDAEIKRMADTAIKTAAYANGQTVLQVIKEKVIGFSREELEEEIAYLLEQQTFSCALTGYDFRKKPSNKHLWPSLDRKDSSLGYIPENLQIVTRAANFYKSASDDADWLAKAEALEKMAIAIQKRRKNSTLLSAT